MDYKLKTKDIILFSRIVARMDVKLDLKGVMNATADKDNKDNLMEATADKDNKDNLMEVGFDIIMQLVPNLYKAEDEFYQLIGSICNITPEDAAVKDITEMIDVLKIIWVKLVNFFKQPTG